MEDAGARPIAKARRKPTTTYAAPALEKGIDILELLANEPGGLTSSEIAQRLDRSLGQIFRIVMVMERRGWLCKGPGTDRYAVSHRVLDTARRATPAQALNAIAPDVMHELSLAVAQSCHMAIVADATILIILQQDSPAPSAFGVRPGTRCDAFASCSGHVLLAFSDAATRKRVISARPPVSDAEMNMFCSRLPFIRARGYDIKSSSRSLGVTDISYPIFGAGGRIRAALTVPFLATTDDTQEVDIEHARRHLESAARKISSSLGWSEEPLLNTDLPSP